MKSIILIALLFVINAILVIMTIIKNKKIIEASESLAKVKDIDNKLEKALQLRGFKIKGIRKISYNISYNNRMAEVKLERSIFLKKAFKKYILLINNAEEKYTENIELRKKSLEYNYASNLGGVVIFNEKDKSIDIVNFHNKREIELINWIYLGLVIIVLLLILNIFFILNFTYK